MIETMTFKEVLQRFRTESFTEREKGAKFEKLIKKWFQTDPAMRINYRRFGFGRNFRGKRISEGRSRYRLGGEN